MRIPVDEAPAGPAMDAAVAEALGRKVKITSGGNVVEGPIISHPHGCGLIADFIYQPQYSTDIAAAWELVERLYVQWDGFFALLCDTGHWHCEGVEDFMENRVHAIADTAPLAICRAFLRANGVTEIEMGSEDVS